MKKFAAGPRFYITRLQGERHRGREIMGRVFYVSDFRAARAELARIRDLPNDRDLIRQDFNNVTCYLEFWDLDMINKDTYKREKLIHAFSQNVVEFVRERHSDMTTDAFQDVVCQDLHAGLVSAATAQKRGLGFPSIKEHWKKCIETMVEKLTAVAEAQLYSKALQHQP